MGTRSGARRQILEQAHEGHERVPPTIRVERVGPRRWLASSEMGYDYTETVMNWKLSKAQTVGMLIILFGLAAVLVIAILLRP